MIEDKIIGDSKRMIAVCILDILSTETGYIGDGDSLITMTCEDIIKRLKEKYGIEVRRKAIYDNMNALLEMQDNEENKPFFEIAYETRERIVNGKTQSVRSNFYMVPEKDPKQENRLSDGEFLMLVGYIQNNKTLDSAVALKLIEKLEAFSQDSFARNHANFSAKEEYYAPLADFLGGLKTINIALTEGKQIVFDECEYVVERENDPPLDLKAIEKNIFLNPYRIVVSQGKYYLIGTKSGEQELCHYKIDKMLNIRITSAAVSRFRDEEHIEDYLDEHPYMNEGKKISVKLYVREGAIGKVVDEFGTNLKITECEDKFATWNDYYAVELDAGEEDMFRFALMNADILEILEPQALRNRMRRRSREMNWDYQSGYEDLYFSAIDAVPFSSELNVHNIDLSNRREYQETNPMYATFKNTNLLSIDFLSARKYDRLWELRLIDNPIKDISPLQSVPTLAHLTLIKTGVSDISTLAKLDRIRTLALFDNPIEDYSVLFQLWSLNQLHIGVAESQKIDIDALQAVVPNLEIVIGNPQKYMGYTPNEQQADVYHYHSYHKNIIGERKEKQSANRTADKKSNCRRYHIRPIK